MNAAWHKYLPNVLRTRLDGHHGLQAVVGNIGWLFADRILRMGVGLVVGVWIARYLGPQQFGLWNFAIAFAALFGAVASFGLDGIVVRELVNDQEHTDELLGSAFVVKLVGGLIALSGAIAAIFFLRPGETAMMWLVGISAATFVAQSSGVIDFYFQAKVQSRYSVYAANGAFILTTAVKIGLLLISAPLLAFAWTGLGEAFLVAFFLLLAYRMNRHDSSAWQYKYGVACKLVKESWPLIFSGITVMIYMRIDQIMIGQMLGDKEVGLFSAAVRLSEIWYFVPMAIANSVFPAIVASKAQGEPLYYSRLQSLFRLMVYLGIVVAIITTFVGDYAVVRLFGPDYAKAASVLIIHIWSGVFVGLGVASSMWLTIENLQKYSLYRTLSGSVMNVALNIALIPRFGIEGAATATVISQFFTAFLFDLFNKRTRPVFFMKLKAFNPLPRFSTSIQRR